MLITNQAEFEGIQKISEAVAVTLKKMKDYTQPGMSAYELDEYGGKILAEFGAKSAPKKAYDFPGFTCICVNHEIAHGIPTKSKIFKEGDLINIDVSGELKNFWADNGGSFVLGADINNHQPLVNASKDILKKALQNVKGGVRVAEVGRLIEMEARKYGYKVIKNLVGHGVGRSLHEEPTEIPCYYDRENTWRFKKNTTIAIETFISTRTTQAHQTKDGWTLIAKDGSFVTQHEHTLLVTDALPEILTASNGVFDW
jgi:methionyl aminopeptidase